MCEILENMMNEEREEGIIIGRNEGIAIGEEHSKIGIAIQLIRLGELSLEKIAMCTGLSIEKVKSLQIS